MKSTHKLTLDELARKWTAFLVAVLLVKLHGKAVQDIWLWELTPFPIGIPGWNDCAMGFMAALLPPPFHAAFVNTCLDTSYRQMDVAHERFKRDHPLE